MLFKLLLLEGLYQLSDGQVVWMAKDSLSFRSFLGLEGTAWCPTTRRWWCSAAGFANGLAGGIVPHGERVCKRRPLRWRAVRAARARVRRRSVRNIAGAPWSAQAMLAP